MEKSTLQHPLLTGEHELTIDEKNRLLVPSDIRRRLVPDRDGDAFYLVVGVNRKTWIYPEKYFEALTQAPPEPRPKEESLDWDQMLALAHRQELDGQGRILIPDKLLKRTGTQREVTLIGARNHLELWNRPDWDVRREEIWQRWSRT